MRRCGNEDVEYVVGETKLSMTVRNGQQSELNGALIKKGRCTLIRYGLNEAQLTGSRFFSFLSFFCH